MKKNNLILLALTIPFFTACSVKDSIVGLEKKASEINHYEKVSIKLAKENRELTAHIKRLEFEIEKLKQETAFRSNHASVSAVTSRGIASVSPVRAFDLKGTKDLVEFSTYKWSAEDMMKIADKEFKAKNFIKAAQFYNSIIEQYPKYEKINDEFLFKAGVSSYETKIHNDWTLTHFNNLLKHYPKSTHYRSAKLWVALTHLRLGEKEKFFTTVEEFRKKYRNTNEWKILSSYYESIVEKTNE